MLFMISIHGINKGLGLCFWSVFHPGVDLLGKNVLLYLGVSKEAKTNSLIHELSLHGALTAMRFP